jgi:serine/threonine protein phosphatase PrpC
MILRAAACSDVGMRRQVNEDCYALAPELGLYLVADGMGGHKAGQVASQLATDAALQAVQALQGATVGVAEILRHAVACANHEILKTAEDKPEFAGMGTTLVAVLALGDRLGLVHVGDSRAYIVRGGRIRALTDDHSVVGELVRRRQITEDDARAHPHRHVLTRALGVRSSTEPDLAEITPQVGDTFVLCSDGLTTHMRDHEIAYAATECSDPQDACNLLVAHANQRGGTDNITVVLLRYETDGEAPTAS